VTTSHPQGIAALAEVPHFEIDDLFRGNPLLVLAAGIQDPGNLGTLVRSGEAFGATGIIRLPGTVDLWNSKTLRASAGSAFRLPVLAMSAEEAFALLKRRGVRMCATVPRGGGAGGEILRGPCALLIGNEGAGVPSDWMAQADEHITIPCPGEAESLNAAVAGSILLYEAAKQRKAAEHR
jgi:TrmH family RNA methyltransferase